MRVPLSLTVHPPHLAKWSSTRTSAHFSDFLVSLSLSFQGSDHRTVLDQDGCCCFGDIPRKRASRKSTPSLHYLTPHIRVTEWASRVAAHPTRGPGKGPRKRWGRKMEWRQGWTSGSRRARGERLVPPATPPPARPWRLPVQGAQRLLCPHPLHLPRLGSTLRRRQGARDTPWCGAQTVPPPCVSAAPPVRPEPPRSAPRRPAGDAARRHPPRSPRATPRAARSLLPPCCVSAAWDPRSGDDPGPQTSLH